MKNIKKIIHQHPLFLVQHHQFHLKQFTIQDFFQFLSRINQKHLMK